MHFPIKQLKLWIDEEQQSGAPNAQQAVLSSATLEAVPHARVVAIREINEKELLFFTQKGTRKVTELTNNPLCALTFWFELQQKEAIIEGTAEPLSTLENEHYWNKYPREAQIRFHSYAPTSAQRITNKHVLEERKKTLTAQYHGSAVPMSEFYCGFRIKPRRIVFYAYRIETLSDVAEYVYENNEWVYALLSP